MKSIVLFLCFTFFNTYTNAGEFDHFVSEAIVTEADNAHRDIISKLENSQSVKEADLHLKRYLDKIRELQSQVFRLRLKQITSEQIDHLSITQDQIGKLSRALSKNFAYEKKTNLWIALWKTLKVFAFFGGAYAYYKFLEVPTDWSWIIYYPAVFAKYAGAALAGVIYIITDAFDKLLSINNKRTKVFSLYYSPLELEKVYKKATTSNFRLRLVKKGFGIDTTKSNIIPSENTPAYTKESLQFLSSQLVAHIDLIMTKGDADSMIKKSAMIQAKQLAQQEPTDLLEINKSIETIQHALKRLGSKFILTTQLLQDTSPLIPTIEVLKLVMPPAEFADLSLLLKKSDITILSDAPNVTPYYEDHSLKIFEVSMDIYLTNGRNTSSAIKISFKVNTKGEQSYNQLRTLIKTGAWRNFFDPIEYSENYQALTLWISEIKAAVASMSSQSPSISGAPCKSQLKTIPIDKKQTGEVQ